jgi:anti-sigma factor RsiW
MKCSDYEKQMLLYESQELPPRERRQLESHLKTCASCCSFLHLLQKSVQEPADEPSIDCLHTVNEMLRQKAPLRSRPIHLRRRAIAIAASLLIGLGLFALLYPQEKVGLELTLRDTQLLEMDEQLVESIYLSLTEDDLAFNFLMMSDG